MADTNYAKLKVPELKDLCRQRSLPVSGTKAILIDRLQGLPPPEKPAGKQPSGKSRTQQEQLANVETARSEERGSQSAVVGHDSSSLAQTPAPFSQASVICAPSVSQVPPSLQQSVISAAFVGMRLPRPATQSSTSPQFFASISSPPAPSNLLSAPRASRPAVPNSVVRGEEALRPPAKRPTLTRAQEMPSKRHLSASLNSALARQAGVVPFRRVFKSPVSTSPRSKHLRDSAQANALPPSSFQLSIEEEIAYIQRIWANLLPKTGSSTGQTSALLRECSASLLMNDGKGSRATIVALRFLLARLYTALLSLEDGMIADLPERPKLEGVTKVADGISIATLASGEKTPFVELTGEPIGTEKASKAKVSENVMMRRDWNIYLTQRSTSARSLPEQVQTSDPEQYPHGISKHFRSRCGGSDTRLTCAESYVLANSAPNSISGTWKPLHTLASELNSDPIITGTSSLATKGRIALYLSPAHHVESISLSATSGKLLHPAVCSVQVASGRAHLCFRLTGQVIGNEDDGVVEIWQRLL